MSDLSAPPIGPASAAPAQAGAANRIGVSIGDIRACAPEDLPTVARLFQSAFRDPASEAPASLHSCLRELFFEYPWDDPELPSRVYITPDGKLRGFIGVLPLRMSFRGERIRAAVPSSMMVDRPEEHPLAGARLLRSFLNGPQDISISEPLNPLTQGMWERLGGQSMPTESMEWLRVFRPAGFGLARMGERYSAARVLRPLGTLVDRAAASVAGASLQPCGKMPDYATEADVSDDVLIGHIAELTADYELRPEWDPACLKWMLAHAGRNAGRGTLFRRMVYGHNEIPLGCYLYHGRPNEMAWVLQILARPDAVGPVLDSLFAHAYRHGSVAVKGRTQLRLMDGLLRRQCIFFRRHSAAVHSRNPQLLAAVRSGEALTSGLAAESWTRLIGDTFS